MRKTKLLGIIVLVAMLGLSMTGCPTDPPEPTVTGVTVNPATANVVRGESHDFNAMVLGTNDHPTTVAWTVAGGVSGTAISGTGRLTIAANETTTSLTVRATSTLNNSAIGTAIVTVTDPPAIVTSVTVTPATASVARGGNYDFTATVQGANNPPQTVTWAVTGGSIGTSISTAGRLTVAANETATSLTVRATSIHDTSISGTASVIVTVPGTGATVTNVTVTPETSTVVRGGNQDFTVSVSGTNNPPSTVTWTVTGGIAETSISTAGRLTVSANETATLLTVRATSTYDTSRSGTATVTVVASDTAVSQLIANAVITVTAPVTGAMPNATASGFGNFTIGAVSWSPAHNPFQGGTAYTATVTLTANAGFTFTSGLTGTVSINGNRVTPIIASSGGTATLSHTFMPTDPVLQPIANAVITVTAPVTGAMPNATASGFGNFTIGAVSWSPAHNPFQGGTTYTATVTLTANAGFTFTGGLTGSVFINGNRVTPIIAGSGGTAILSHTFTPTDPVLQPITNAIITVTAPVTGAIPNTIASGFGNFTVGAVSWSPAHNPFQGGIMYTATVTLTADENFTFTGGLTGSVSLNGSPVTPTIAWNGRTATLSHTFAPTVINLERGFAISLEHFVNPELDIDIPAYFSLVTLLTTPLVIEVASPGNYAPGSIRWVLNNVDITNTMAVNGDFGEVLTLSAPLNEGLHLRIGGNTLTATVRMGGTLYSYTVTFEVR